MSDELFVRIATAGLSLVFVTGIFFVGYAAGQERLRTMLRYGDAPDLIEDIVRRRDERLQLAELEPVDDFE